MRLRARLLVLLALDGHRDASATPKCLSMGFCRGLWLRLILDRRRFCVAETIFQAVNRGGSS